ncbi:MAG: universal stress protein [Moraxellaceae bacterium]
MYRKVMVGFDGGLCAGVALQQGMQLAAAGAELLLLTVVPYQALCSTKGLPPAGGGPEHARDLLEQAWRHLARYDVHASLQLVDLSSRPAGDVATEIIAAATAAEADLIILGTRGRIGCRRLRPGSVAESVSRRALCPILLVGAPDPADFSCLNPVELYGMWPDSEHLHPDT